MYQPEYPKTEAVAFTQEQSFNAETDLHNNQAEFQRLREEDKQLAITTATIQTFIAATLLLPQPLTQLGFAAGGSIITRSKLKRSKKIHEILRNGRALDENFRDRDIQVFCDTPIPDYGRLDLFLKFPIAPQKAIFTVALRSQGKGKILYNEQKEALYIRSDKGGLKPWKPDHIERLAMQESWLRRNRQAEFFGTSSRDKNRPAIKLLVTTGETKVGQHADHLYREVGDQRVLLLQRRSSVYVLEESQLVGFIQGWFAQKQ